METTDEIDEIAPHVRRAAASPRRVSLIFSWGDSVHALPLAEGEVLVVGRAEPSQLIIAESSLSRAHARIAVRNGRVTLVDLGSKNGSFVNGKSLSAATVIGAVDVVHLGAVELRVCGRALHDDTLEIVSHSSFVRSVSEEISRARTFARSLCVLAIKYDDDAELRLLEQPLLQSLRSFDRLCSYAPGIWLVLLPECDAAAARRWIASVRCLAGLDRHTTIVAYPGVDGTAEELVSAALDACHERRDGAARECAGPRQTAVSGAILISPKMLRLYELVDRAARTTMPVLIQGETGTGKELVARALHERSQRSQSPFKAVNCATIPLNLLESILFGYERGAFTGAERSSPGLFEQAQGGTVFLDEVGELSPHAQAALLRVLEQRSVIRVGATREVAVDVRVVAATHRDLLAMVESGNFREDLLFRLDALTLTVPPLRERREEILPLAEHFLARARAHWGIAAEAFSERAMQALLDFRWPGNVRQLKNAVERAGAICVASTIGVEDLPPQLRSTPPHASPLLDLDRQRHESSLAARLREFEIAILRDALQRSGGNQAAAARLLSVPRRTFAYKLQTLGVLGD